MPYQPGTIRRSGIAVLRQQRLAVHGPDQQHVVAQRHVAAQAAAEGVLMAAVEAAVGADERDLDGVVEQADAVQQMTQRRAGPLGSADRLADPGHARIARGHRAAAVAGAFERHGKRACGEAANFVEREKTRFADAARHLDLPFVVGHIGHVEMIEQIVQHRQASRRGAASRAGCRCCGSRAPLPLAQRGPRYSAAARTM